MSKSWQVMTRKKTTVRPRHQKNRPRRYLGTSIILNLNFAIIALYLKLYKIKINYSI